MHPVARLLNELSWSARGLRISCAVLLGAGLLSAAALGGLGRWLLPDLEAEPDPIHRLYGLYLYRTDFHYILQQPEPLPPEGWDVPSVFTEPSARWLPRLRAAADAPSPPRGVRFALGLWRMHLGDSDRAISRLHAENADFPHPLVRRTELDAALRAGRYDYLDALREEPAYAEQMAGWFMVDLALRRNDWRGVLRHFLPAQYRGVPLSSLLLALLAGGVWWVLLASLLPGRARPRQILLMGLALGLGWISTWPTLLSGMWMDRALNLSEGADFLSTLLFQIVSVGLREEVCKLLLFLPLLPWALRRDRDIEALLFGAMVGLGFAVEENLNYLISHTAQGTGVSRFVSANFLHLSLTGITSLALVRAVRDPDRWLADSLQVLAMAIGLHALYNTLLSQPVPGLGDMSYFSGTALAGCALLFFREVKSLAPLRARRLSRTALFLWGFCILFNLELLVAALQLPFGQALAITGQAAVAGLLTGYIFLHLIDEPIGP